MKNLSMLIKLMVFCLLLLGLSGCKPGSQPLLPKEQFKAQLIVLSNGKLEFIDGEGKTVRSVGFPNPVHDFLWVDSSTIFFTAKSNGNLLVMKYDPQLDSIHKVAEIESKSESETYWDNNDFNEMFLKNGKLHILCDFFEEMPLMQSARKKTEVDLNSGKYLVTSRNSGNGDLFSGNSEEAGRFERHQVKGKFEQTKDVELSYTDENGKKQVITNTPFNKLSQVEGGGIGFQVLPGGKRVIFYVVQSFGDYLHGPVFAVNLDGSNQTKLADDIMLFNSFAIPPEGKVFFSPDGQALFALKADNSFIKIRENFKKVRRFGKHQFLNFEMVNGGFS